MSTVGPAAEPSSLRGRACAGRNSWVGYSQLLQFALGDLCLWEVSVPGITLDVPFTKLGTDLAETLPPWEEAPPGVEVAVISGQPVERDLPSVTLLPDSIRYVTVNENRYYIALGGSFAGYLNKFSSKSRSTLLRKVRKFAALSGGRVRAREYRTPPEMPEFLRLARQVSARTYQERLGRGLPGTEDFRRSLDALAGRDSARGYVLFHGERPVAYVLCLAQQNNLVYEHLGYDADFRGGSPGVVLLYTMLERLFAEKRFEYLDFGGTEYDYKEFFSTGSIRCARVYYFRRTWRGAFLVFSHYAFIKLSLAASTVLGALRLKGRVKHILRLLQVRREAAN